MTSPLSFYDVAAAASAAFPLDLGSIAPASSDDTQLRVHNDSGAYQADDVIVTVTGGDDGLDLYLSLDGDTYTASVGLGDIPPGAYSPVFWMRRITDSFAADGTRLATLQATPADWSQPGASGTSDNIPLETGD